MILPEENNDLDISYLFTDFVSAILSLMSSTGDGAASDKADVERPELIAILL